MSRLKLLTLFLATALLQFVRANETDGCPFIGHTYKPGDTWYPKLQSQRSRYCVTCRCTVNDNKPSLNCSSVQCPTTCTGEEQHGCCSVCSGMKRSNDDQLVSSSTTSHQRDAASQSFKPPLSGGFTSQSIRNGIENNYSRRCSIGGVSYGHGETFPGNNSDKRKDKCNHCSCNNGKAQCKIKSCPPVSCSNPVVTLKNCCPTCPGDIDSETNWDTMVSFSTGGSSGKSSTHKDCKNGDKYYDNGASWHPVIGPFGEMDCVLCKCNSGRIDCARLKCHSKRDLPCEKPIKVTGHCCPVCQNHAEVYKNELTTSEIDKGDFKRCISTRSQFTVWKSNGGGKTSQVLQFLFTPLSSNSKFEIHHHQFISRNSVIDTITAQSVSFDKYSQLKSNFQFTLIGGTTKRLVNKLEKREGKLMRKCSRFKTSMPPKEYSQSQNPCGTNIPNFEGILKLRKIQYKQWCGAGEREI